MNINTSKVCQIISRINTVKDYLFVLKSVKNACIENSKIKRVDIDYHDQETSWDLTKSFDSKQCLDFFNSVKVWPVRVVFYY